jgi:DNA polymerase-3 subunit epsilon
LCSIVDTLTLARSKHPGQRNSLDALCQRYHVDNASRTLHGALLDAEILADVFLIMTGGQTSLGLHDEPSEEGSSGLGARGIRRLSSERKPLPVINATASELSRHENRLDQIATHSGGAVLWREH